MIPITIAMLMQAAPGIQVTPDSVYSTDAVRHAVSAAAIANREAPPALRAYRAHIETEMALIIVDTLGRERMGQVEQMGGTATWSVASGYEAHVEGYRTQTTGLPVSMLGFVRGWSLPMLYGQRLLVGIEGSGRVRDTTARGRRRDSLIAVHPFAADRERYYTYSGGDTVAVLSTAVRRTPLVRIKVTPNLEMDAQFAAFDGEIHIDAERHEIVRMRGRFVVSAARERHYPLMSRLMIKATGTVAVAYIEFVNAEYDGRYWLPTTQRMEFQATMSMLGGVRSVFRVVSRFSDFDIDDTSSAILPGMAAYTRRRVTYAPSDSMSAFNDWRTALGTASSSVGANDFEDVAPPQWKTDGPPRITLYPSRLDRTIHYNRIEGLYTGAELSVEMRGSAPGVVGRVHGGWAWSEKTVRGGLSLSRRGKSSSSAVLLERSLAPTQDFERDMQSGASSIGSFISSIEEADYVDRWLSGVTHTQFHRSIDHALTTTRLAVARDRDVPASLTHGPVRRSVAFLPNRHAANGTYAIAGITHEYHPNVTGEYLAPGVGATLQLEAATGDLRWAKAVASAAARTYAGPVTFAARLDAGAVLSDAPPPQTLFELGGVTNRLSGYRYKEFAGDRAAVFRGFSAYAFPVFRSPIRFRQLVMPGLTPGIGAGIDGGWTGISSAGARKAVLQLGDGTEANAVSTETGTVRSTVSVGMTLFANSVFVGRARPIDRAAPWRWVFGIGQGF